jgi:hypothetical protein
MAEQLSDKEVSAALTRALGRAPHRAVWSYALKSGWVGDVRSEIASGVSLDEAVASLAERCREVEHLASEIRAGPPEQGETRIDPDRRALALARILAADASCIPEVETFRRRRLRGNLVERSRVPDWIGRRRRPRAARVLLTATADEEAIHPHTVDSPRQVQTLSYLTAEDPFPRAVILPGAGALVELKAVASRLVLRYAWTEAEATTFVLTGGPPVLPLLRATINHRSPWGAASTISLEVHPQVSPTALAHEYRGIRAEVLGPRRRYRAVRELHRAELAAVCAENNDGRPWVEMMQMWNRNNPRHRYRDVRRFVRDARETFKMITGETLDWAGAPRSKQRARQWPSDAGSTDKH